MKMKDLFLSWERNKRAETLNLMRSREMIERTLFRWEIIVRIISSSESELIFIFERIDLNIEELMNWILMTLGLMLSLMTKNFFVWWRSVDDINCKNVHIKLSILTWDRLDLYTVCVHDGVFLKYVERCIERHEQMLIDRKTWTREKGV